MRDPEGPRGDKGWSCLFTRPSVNDALRHSAVTRWTCDPDGARAPVRDHTDGNVRLSRVETSAARSDAQRPGTHVGLGGTDLDTGVPDPGLRRGPWARPALPRSSTSAPLYSVCVPPTAVTASYLASYRWDLQTKQRSRGQAASVRPNSVIAVLQHDRDPEEHISDSRSHRSSGRRATAPPMTP